MPKYQKKWVIVKVGRVTEDKSYSGATWDRAGLRPQYQEVYFDFDQAMDLAMKLSEYNPLGFKVVEIDVH